MKKALTIEDLKQRIGKPVFVIATTDEFKNKTKWYVVSKINEFKADNKNHGYIEFTDCNCINFENTQFFKIFDVEVTEAELKEILDTEEKAEKKTGYERVGRGTKYYTITSEFKTINTCETAYKVDDVKYNIANYFNDEKLCENIARAERLRYKLRQYAALNGGIPSRKDWDIVDINKHYIKYLYRDKRVVISQAYCNKEFGQVYFKNVEACKKAMQIFKDELMWYFTEFEEMLS